jgi:hypothetical protein
MQQLTEEQRAEILAFLSPQATSADQDLLGMEYDPTFDASQMPLETAPLPEEQAMALGAAPLAPPLAPPETLSDTPIEPLEQPSGGDLQFMQEEYAAASKVDQAHQMIENARANIAGRKAATIGGGGDAKKQEIAAYLQNKRDADNRKYSSKESEKKDSRISDRERSRDARTADREIARDNRRPKKGEGKGEGTSGFKNTNNMRKDYMRHPTTKDTDELASAYRKIVGAADSSSAAGDLSLIFAYMKMLDPGSTVREGEFATAQNTAGIPDRIRNAYNKAKDGTRLADDQRSGFVDGAKTVWDAQMASQGELDQRFEKFAGEYDIDFDKFRGKWDIKIPEAKARKAPEEEKGFIDDTLDALGVGGSEETLVPPGEPSWEAPPVIAPEIPTTPDELSPAPTPMTDKERLLEARKRRGL